MNRFIFTLAILTTLQACSSNSVKEKINKAGDVAGQAAGEFIEGATKGVVKAFDVKIDLPKSLEEKGLRFGKATISSDSIGTDNLLTLYVIFKIDFQGKLWAKVFDQDSLEMGRAYVNVTGKKDESLFLDFHFDKRTNIDSKNRISVEELNENN